MQENLQIVKMEKMTYIFADELVDYTWMSRKTFKIPIGCRITSYCEELSSVLQNVQHTWLSHTKCQ